MKRKIINKALLFMFGLVLSSLFFTSCKESTMEGMIIYTQVPKNLQVINYINGNNWRYFSNSQIVLINPNKNNKSLKVLTNNFYSACSPQISFDGKSMIFSAQ